MNTLSMDAKKTDRQVVSKQRVLDYGEVYTNRREVNAMLDLVKQETERIDSRFLEPACGTGNFLSEILERKLKVVASRYKRSQLEYERYSVIAISSLYGIDILEDNIRICRQRLLTILATKYQELYVKKVKDSFLSTIRFVLSRNIIWGDALTLRMIHDPNEPIVFSEWSFPFNDSKIKRKDYIFEDLLNNDTSLEDSLFSAKPEISDIGRKVPPAPKEIRSYPMIHFLRLGANNE